MELDLCKINWIAISAVASFVMVVVTWCSLRQMKRQWEEERRPNLSFVVMISGLSYFLKISNTGKRNAFNIKIKFNQEFLNSVLDEGRKKRLKTAEKKSFFIEAGQSKYLYICECEDEERIHREIIITGKYCDKYRIDEYFNIEDFLPSMIVKDVLTTDIGHIREGLVVRNDHYYPIQKSLDIIAKHLENRADNKE